MRLFSSAVTRRVWIALLFLLLLSVASFAQQERQSDAGPPSPQQVQPATPANPNAPAPAAAPDASGRAPAKMQISSPASSTPTEMFIGPGDEGDMNVFSMPELTTHFRVESTGDVNLPLIGKFHIAGMSAEDAQAALEKKYEEGGFLRNPHITVFIKEYTTQGISVLGEVNRPGIYSALNARRLYDLFLIAGGLSPRAGKTVTITHTKDPEHPVVVTLENGGFSANQGNVEIQPGDTIMVSRAGVVYVIGEVNRPGMYVMETAQTASMLQMLALAAGPTRMAALGHTRLIRRTAKGLESQDINLKKIMQAKSGDVDLQAEDIMFVPSSRGKAALERGSGSVLNMLTSLALYHF
jgi:polysaccharide export outer membrane protein